MKIDELKTGYEWCLEANMRILDLNDWPQDSFNESSEEHYFKEPITRLSFLEIIKSCKVKPNSTPRKTRKFLEWRMYGFVPYNMSGIQKGIQFGHAVVRYCRAIRGINALEDDFNNWADNYETFIILNGGTTNENKNGKWYGSLQRLRDEFNDNEIVIAEFKEPDLNDTLTGFVFLVDERVYDKTLYPDYVDCPKPWADKRRYKPTEKEMADWEAVNAKNREAWVEKIGGPKNDFLRSILLGKKLA